MESRPTKWFDISYYRMKGNIVDCQFGPTTSDPLDLYQCISSNGLNQMGPTSAWVFYHLVKKKKNLTINFFESEREVGKKIGERKLSFKFF